MQSKSAALILGLLLFAGIVGAASVVSQSMLDIKQLERSVKVKGLAEREVKANTVIWPIQFAIAGNDLVELYKNIEANNAKITEFLIAGGIDKSEISYSMPAIVDSSAQSYASDSTFRFSSSQSVTVYSSEIDSVRALMTSLTELGKQGIVINSNDYQARVEYLFTGLNSIKPEMVQLATSEARAVAQKFAQDSESRLGKIKSATQGQFSISDRDSTNPHIKKVRVVSTIEYYLAD